jgi:hypothetical protein
MDEGVQALMMKSKKLKPEKKKNEEAVPEINTLALQADTYLKSLQHHQEAFLEWLNSLSQTPTLSVDRYQYRKIR